MRRADVAHDVPRPRGGRGAVAVAPDVGQALGAVAGQKRAQEGVGEPAKGRRVAGRREEPSARRLERGGAGARGRRGTPRGRRRDRARARRRPRRRRATRARRARADGASRAARTPRRARAARVRVADGVRNVPDRNTARHPRDAPAPASASAREGRGLVAGAVRSDAPPHRDRRRVARRECAAPLGRVCAPPRRARRARHRTPSRLRRSTRRGPELCGRTVTQKNAASARKRPVFPVRRKRRANKGRLYLHANSGYPPRRRGGWRRSARDESAVFRALRPPRPARARRPTKSRRTPSLGRGLRGPRASPPARRARPPLPPRELPLPSPRPREVWLSHPPKFPPRSSSSSSSLSPTAHIVFCMNDAEGRWRALQETRLVPRVPRPHRDFGIARARRHRSRRGGPRARPTPPPRRQGA